MRVIGEEEVRETTTKSNSRESKVGSESPGIRGVGQQDVELRDSLHEKLSRCRRLLHSERSTSVRVRRENEGTKKSAANEASVEERASSLLLPHRRLCVALSVWRSSGGRGV